MLAWPDIAIIIGYFVIVLGLGAYVNRYIKSQEDFFLAGRKMPWRSEERRVGKECTG
jgi:Na+/proline symporter